MEEITEELTEELMDETPAPPESTEEDAQSEAAESDAPLAEEVREDAPAIDYAALAKEDLAAIKALCPDLNSAAHLGELPFAARFAELRDLGLSVREALGACLPDFAAKRSKNHLRTDVPRGNAPPEDSLSADAMRAAKELFYGLSEKEINALYRRVTQ